MDPSASSLERDLLESWSAEQPSAEAKARALAIAGLGATVAGAAGAAAGSTVAPKAAGLMSMVAVKWAMIGVLVAGVGAAAFFTFRSHDARVPATPSPPSTAIVSPVTATVPPPTATPVAPPPTTVTPTDVPAVPPVQSRTATTATAIPRPSSTAATAADGSLAEEIAAFDRVHAALDAGDADRALGLVDAYERRYPAGTFQQEAEVLRVEALVKKGDRAQAVRVGQRFLAAHPRSPHAGRIRAIVDASTP